MNKVVKNKTYIFLFFTLFPLFNIYPIQNHPTQLVLDRITEQPAYYPIKFIFWGDSRNDEFSYTADSIFAILRDEINILNPDFVIHGGDFRLHGRRYEYYRFVGMIDSFDVNLLTVRGNHELYAEEGPYMYDSIFGKTDYYFDYGKYRFIILADCQQSPLTGNNGYHYVDYLIYEEQLQWLNNLLDGSKEKNLIPVVIAHVPPYIPGHDTTYCLGYSSYFPKPNYELSHTEEFTDMLSQYKVPLALFSHQHFYDRHTYNDVMYVISGGAGSRLIPSISPIPYGGSFYHFIVFYLYSNGNIKGEIYKAGDSQPDQRFTFYISNSSIVSNKKELLENKRSIVFKKGKVYSFSGNSYKLLSITGENITKNAILKKRSSTQGTLLNTKNLKRGIYFLYNTKKQSIKKIILF